MDCVHWGKGGDTRFEDGALTTDFVCQKCGAEYQVRAKYVPWNTPTNEGAYRNRVEGRKALAEEAL